MEKQLHCVNPSRIRKLLESKVATTGVVYLMSRDQRVKDNWAILHAQKVALDNKVPLLVCFNLSEEFLEGTWRHCSFMLKGLEQVSNQLKSLKIPFVILKGECSQNIPKLMDSQSFNYLVSDFSPLKINKMWIESVKENLLAKKKDFYNFDIVDAHNIVPVWVASDKVETGARTIRPKILNHLPEFLVQFPDMVSHSLNTKKILDLHGSDSFEDLKKFDKCDKSVAPVTWIEPGYEAGMKELLNFTNQKLQRFNTDRNDPNLKCISNFSPWLHFGQISAQAVALEILKHGNSNTIKNHKELWKTDPVNSFLEELIVRRELADNFCNYSVSYDTLEGCSGWARLTLNEHKNDKREVVHTLEEFENAKTHDELWNSAQIQMVETGKMHGFLRMYWCKKILEWTSAPEEALKVAIYLNDKYSLDGKDPNGYTGIMWSIAGVHDQGWAERQVFGKIRYMNRQGCDRKFDTKKFISNYPNKAKRLSIK